MKVLLIIEQCNPEESSVPLVGYNYFYHINQLVETHLVTHERNQKSLSKLIPEENITYIPESQFSKIYYRMIVSTLSYRGRVNWPLFHILSFPIYEEFNRRVYKKFERSILNKEYDIVHALTPMMPRYPVKAVRACTNTPFLLGPVNGGLPFPKGFTKVANQEYGYLNFFRVIGRAIIPGYKETYKKADKILSGSTYTLNLLKDIFQLSDDKLKLHYENGIDSSFLQTKQPLHISDKIRLLFVGRLVPYKSADVVIDALHNLSYEIKQKIHLTIVGDGSERVNLENQIAYLNLGNIVTLTGWINQQETAKYYRESDIFCFPSIREFGGAVVMEAMANSLPCIVVNNGGIGEYVTEKTGFKIEPLSREYLVQEMANNITILVENQDLRSSMSMAAIARAKEFEWSNKAKEIVNIYEELRQNYSEK